MATTVKLTEIYDQITDMAKEACLEKLESGKFDEEAVKDFDAATDVNIALLITKPSTATKNVNGVWAVGQPCPILPELTVMYIFRGRDEAGEIDTASNARVWCIPTKDKTDKGYALSPTCLTIDWQEIQVMGEGMSLDTFKESVADEIVELYESAPEEEEEPGVVDASAVTVTTTSNGSTTAAVATS